jgi:hypothetical protein
MKAASNTFEIFVSPRKFKQVLLLLFILNVLVLGGTWLHGNKLLGQFPNGVKRIIAQLNLGAENVVASWYSSMLLLLVGLAAAGCYFADRQRLQKPRDKFLNLGWIVFVSIFFLLSFDEMGSFHELIGDTAVFQSLGKGASGGGWYIFYILIALVAGFMMLFFVLKFFRNKLALFLAIAGVGLFLSNPLQENFEIDSWHNSANPATWQRPIGFLLLEEGSELFASYCLLFSFTTYLKYSLQKHPVAGDTQRLPLAMPHQLYLSVFAIILLIIVGLFMLLVQWDKWQIEGAGIPRNWFPSALSFVVALLSYYLYTNRPLGSTGGLNLAFTFGCGLTSLYFGADLYNYDDKFFQILDLTLTVGSLALGIWALKLWGLTSKIGVIAWILLILPSFFTSGPYPPVFGYGAFAALFLALLWRFTHTAAEVKND